jgi:hypothetical protein
LSISSFITRTNVALSVSLVSALARSVESSGRMSVKEVGLASFWNMRCCASALEIASRKHSTIRAVFSPSNTVSA